MTTQLYGGVKGYWRRTRYERLGGGESGLNGRGRWLWRIRISSKLKLKLKMKRKLKLRYSPKKLLIGLRDCYVNLMMRMASSSSPMVAGGGFGEGVVRFGTRPVKEYDDKFIVEIYKTLAMRQAQLVPIDGSEIADPR